MIIRKKETNGANDWDGALAAYEQAVRSLRTLEVTARTPEDEALMVVLYSNSAQAALEKKDYALALRMSGYAIDIDILIMKKHARGIK